MFLPNADKVIINYILNTEHFERKNKARVFASALGITKANANDLISLVKEAVLINDATDNQHLCMAQNILLILVLILMIK